MCLCELSVTDRSDFHNLSLGESEEFQVYWDLIIWESSCVCSRWVRCWGLVIICNQYLIVHAFAENAVVYALPGYDSKVWWLTETWLFEKARVSAHDGYDAGVWWSYAIGVQSFEKTKDQKDQKRLNRAPSTNLLVKKLWICHGLHSPFDNFSDRTWVESISQGSSKRKSVDWHWTLDYLVQLLLFWCDDESNLEFFNRLEIIEGVQYFVLN